MKKILLHTCLGLTLFSTLSAQSYYKILNKHASAGAIELEAYLKTNPNADEKRKTIEYLLKAYEMTGNTERRITLNQELFDDIGSGAETNLYYLHRATVSLFNLKFYSGDRAGAKKVIDDARKKAEGHPFSANFLNQDMADLESVLKMPRKGDTMEVKFTSLQDKKIDLAKMKGSVVLVYFWSTDCMINTDNLPYILKTHEKYHAQGFEIIGISIDEKTDKAKLESFIKDNNIPWPQHFDGKGIKTDLATKYGIHHTSSFLIGPDGTVVVGNIYSGNLEKTVKKHLPK